MVIPGGWVFVMSEVPLHSVSNGDLDSAPRGAPAALSSAPCYLSLSPLSRLSLSPLSLASLSRLSLSPLSLASLSRLSLTRSPPPRLGS